jgi:hypothetical protein
MAGPGPTGRLVFFTLALAVLTTAHPTVRKLGSVDLGILAESTPVFWKGELWLMECIQGGRYYDNINYTSYPDEPQPSGFVRFVNVKSGAHSPSFAYGYGLASALVMGDRMFVHATATPFGIGSNNTVVSVFWSDDLVTWRSNPALGVNQPGVFPEGVTSKTLYNTCVRPVVAAGSGSLSSSYTFVMAYEFNEPGAGWQTGIALTSDPALETAQWVAAPRPANASWGTMAHANPTLRFAEVDGDGGFWYLLTTRGNDDAAASGGVAVEEVWRTRDPASFEWEAPPGWREDDTRAAPFLAPSDADQKPVVLDLHPDTKPLVVGNASALAAAGNINLSDLDLCTVPSGFLQGGEGEGRGTAGGGNTTVMYYAWGNQELGPTAMVLAMAVVENYTEEQVLASYYS